MTKSCLYFMFLLNNKSSLMYPKFILCMGKHGTNKIKKNSLKLRKTQTKGKQLNYEASISSLCARDMSLSNQQISSVTNANSTYHAPKTYTSVTKALLQFLCGSYRTGNETI